MDSHTELYAANRYYHNSYDAAELRNGCTFNDGLDVGAGLYGLSPTSNLVIPSMQRFLNERDRPLFMPSIPEIDAHAMESLPDVPLYSLHSIGSNTRDWPYPQRLTSPTNSTLESSYVSSEWSGRQQSPLASPGLNARPYSPQHDFNDGVAYAYGGLPPAEFEHLHSPDACVALHDVQRCADELPETFAFSPEPITYSQYGSYAQEGYQPMQSGDETTSVESYSTPGTDYPCEEEETPRHEPVSPVIRRRRPQAARSPSISTQVSSGRVSRRPTAGRRASHRSNGDDSHTTSTATGNRAFPCPLAIYGCTSTFGSKNEWKRHVNTQHMRLGYWRCDQCSCHTGERNNKPNDFNRKDLFIQHVRRMHPVDASTTPSTKKSKSKKENSEEQLMQDAATRCYRHLRSAPQKSQCVFCEQHFHGPGSWDERMEHIGRHMENAKKDSDNAIDPLNWRVDEDAENWFLKQQVVVVEGERLILST